MVGALLHLVIDAIRTRGVACDGTRLDEARVRDGIWGEAGRTELAKSAFGA
jgi:hypothetical protein